MRYPVLDTNMIQDSSVKGECEQTDDLFHNLFICVRVRISTLDLKWLWSWGQRTTREGAAVASGQERVAWEELRGFNKATKRLQ